MKIPLFAGGSYTSESINADCQRSVNLYPEAVESGAGKVPAALYGTPGLEVYVTLGDSPVRGIYAYNGRVFAVAGTHAYEILGREQPLGSAAYPVDNTLKAAIDALAASVSGYPNLTADEWGTLYQEVTQQIAPYPETYGFSVGGVYERFAAVSLNDWWTLFTASTPTVRELGADLLNDFQPAKMETNGTQLLILSGRKPYLLNLNDPAATLQEVGLDPLASGTDLVTDASDATKVTSATYRFTSDDTGSWVQITGGTGWTAGWYQILREEDGAVYLDHAPAATGATGGIWSLPVMSEFSGLAYCDGYFILSEANTQQYRISKLYDGTTWDALDFGAAEGLPDGLVAMVADHGELFLLGQQSIEVHRNNGNTDFPFERDPGAFVQQGCLAPNSAISLSNQFFWLGGDARGRGVAWRAQGYMPVRVSTHAIEAEWAKYTTLSDAMAYGYEDRGHAFWVLNFPSADKTWVYDLTTQLWHERAYRDAGTGALSRHRGRCHCFARQMHLVGDRSSGKIFEMSSTIYDDDGADRYYERALPHIANEGIRHFHHSLVLDMETGTAAEGDTEPTVSLEISNDGGHTWSSPITAGIGTLAQYAKRVQWRRLGMAVDRVYRITHVGKRKVAWLHGYLEVEQGRP